MWLHAMDAGAELLCFVDTTTEVETVREEDEGVSIVNRTPLE